MNVMYGLAGLLALLLFGYLVYALLRAEQVLMNTDALFYVLLAALLGIALLCVKPLGGYIADVAEGRPNFALRTGGRFETFVYRYTGIDPGEEMSWPQYAIALLLFNVLGALVVYGLQRLQLFLPLNPQKFAAVSPDSSFNTALSFITNTNWQGYSGESTMGYLVQMAGWRCRISCPRPRASSWRSR